MVDVYYETLNNSIDVARLVNKTIYLKGTNKMGWKLYDEPPDKPYFIIYPDSQSVEVSEDKNEE